jgi:hypothetical protein
MPSGLYPWCVNARKNPPICRYCGSGSGDGYPSSSCLAHSANSTSPRSTASSLASRKRSATGVAAEVACASSSRISCGRGIQPNLRPFCQKGELPTAPCLLTRYECDGRLKGAPPTRLIRVRVSGQEPIPYTPPPPDSRDYRRGFTFPAPRLDGSGHASHLIRRPSRGRPVSELPPRLVRTVISSAAPAVRLAAPDSHLKGTR